MTKAARLLLRNRAACFMRECSAGLLLGLLCALGTDLLEQRRVEEVVFALGKGALHAAGRDVYRTLADNDAYHALQAVGGLIRTGATGTNVNDVAVALVE